MNSIHAGAIVGDNVQMGDGNIVSPNVIIEDNVVIGSNNVFSPGVIVFSGTTIGDNNEFHAGAILGDTPQDVSFSGQESFLKIGDNNKIREYVTIHRGTGDGSSTVVGNNNFFMGYTHVAHNCKIGNGVITVNTVVLGGYVTLCDFAFVSASVVIHQFCRVGKYAIVGGLSAVNQDIPPYIMCGGRPAAANGINSVGLKRAGIKPQVRREIKDAYKILYRSGLSIPNALNEINRQCCSEEINGFVDFIKSSERGIASGGSDKVVRV